MLRALVEQAQQGDRDAFATLVTLVGDGCVAIAYRILRDLDVAEDAVQSATVSAWQDLRSLRDPDRFEAWIHRLVVHACYAEARRATRLRQGSLSLKPDPQLNDPDILTVNDREELERGFLRLPPEQRAVLVFHHYLGLTLPEVAGRLGIPVGTAKSRLHYASAAMRAALEADARVPDMPQGRPA
jgi:RNA polymerase sigma-70 factor (ECF subfamily)